MRNANTSGDTNNNNTNNANGARPVITIKPEAIINVGDGTYENPNQIG